VAVYQTVYAVSTVFIHLSFAGRIGEFRMGAPQITISVNIKIIKIIQHDPTYFGNDWDSHTLHGAGIFTYKTG